MLNNLFWGLFVVVMLYMGLGVFFYIVQAKLIYFPAPTIGYTPDSIGLPYRDVFFETSDGVMISAWYVSAVDSRGVILFCHGNAGNISHRLESIEIFNALGFSVFIFDYRGYGLSQGNPDEQGTYLDAEAAWDYLTMHEGIDPGKIVIFGRSLGGVVATRLAARTSPAGLIAESTFTSVPDMAAAFYPMFPVRLLCRYMYNALEAIREVQVPVLVIHSPDDEIVPYEHGLRLFEAASEPKTFLRIKGGHNDGFLVSGTLYRNGLERFLIDAGSDRNSTQK